jgi:hypothetical protein
MNELKIAEIIDKMSCGRLTDGLGKKQLVFEIESTCGSFYRAKLIDLPKNKSGKIKKATYKKLQREAAEYFYEYLKYKNWLDYSLNYAVKSKHLGNVGEILI